MTREGPLGGGHGCPRARPVKSQRNPTRPGLQLAPEYPVGNTPHGLSALEKHAINVPPFRCRNTILAATVSTMVSTTIAASAVACVFAAALVLPATEAAAYCDGVDCVPNVARNVIPGGACDPHHSYDFGLDSDSKTFVCTTAGVWAPAGPLVGLRNVALPCDAIEDSAQQPDGAPLRCAQVNGTLRWTYRVDTPG